MDELVVKLLVILYIVMHLDVCDQVLVVLQWPPILEQATDTHARDQGAVRENSV